MSMSVQVKEVRDPGRVTVSERVQRLREAVVSAPKEVTADRSHIVTEYYKRSDGEPTVLRRANAFREVLQKIPIAIRDDELIVGALTDRVCGVLFYPDYSHKFLKEEMETLSTREANKVCLREEDKKVLLDDVEYWEGRSVEDRMEVLQQELVGSTLRDLMKARVISGEQSKIPQGRKIVDYPKALNRGLNGIIEEAHQELTKTTISSYEDLNKRHFLQAVVISLEAVVHFAQRHAVLARELAAQEREPARRRELETIAEVCAWVPANPARTFHEALQSFWFTHLGLWIEGSAPGYTPGRFDQYMYPFYGKDKSEGRVSREEALELMGCLWIKFNQNHRFMDLARIQATQASQYQNVTIGGRTMEKKSAVNELSYLILDVTEQVRLPQPTISVRYNDSLPDDFLLRAAEIVRLGGGMPAWFSDKYADAVLPQFGLKREEYWDWSPVGCVKMAIGGIVAPQNNFGSYCVAKCLDLALNNGLDPYTKKQVSPTTGDARQFTNYDQLFDAFKAQVAYAVSMAVLEGHTMYAVYAQLVPIPYSSALMSDCITKGKDLSQGGARYNNFTDVFPFGFVNTANSLYAVKKLVYEDKAISMDELLDALAANFEGKEEVRSLLEAAPKYGNGGEEVERVMSDIFQFVIREASQHCNAFGEPAASGFSGITLHYFHGATIGALPDGRKAYTPLADGSVSAFPGTDTKGPTALINSAAKVDPIPGLATLFNMKLHSSALSGREGLKKLISLVKTYFDLGGYHIQFNVLSRETLLAARKDPHLYRDLLVRIAGFTVFWMDLPSAIQDEIIARTEYDL